MALCEGFALEYIYEVIMPENELISKNSINLLKLSLFQFCCSRLRDMSIGVSIVLRLQLRQKFTTPGNLRKMQKNHTTKGNVTTIKQRYCFN